MIKLFLNFGVSEIFLLTQFLNSCRKFCLWALMIEINVSVVICQLPIRHIGGCSSHPPTGNPGSAVASVSSFGKGAIEVQRKEFRTFRTNGLSDQHGLTSYENST